MENTIHRIMSKYPFIQQHDEKDCGAACLSMICEYYGLKLPIAAFRELIKVDSQGASIYGLITGAKDVGLNTNALEGQPDELFKEISCGEIQFPFIARIVNEHLFEHFLVVYEIKKDMVLVGDPGKNHITKISIMQFVEQWQGQIVTFSPTQSFEKKNERKGNLSKFFRYITSQKKLLFYVFIISMIVSVINVAGAIIFKYILSDAWNIPYINRICITLILMYILRAVLQNIRGYLLAVMTKKIDIPLTLDFYNHLVDLPTSFHETRKTGEFMSRFNDTSRIREVISAAALTIMLDTVMALACGILLFYINPTLFFITLIIIVLYAFVVCLFRRPIKSINYEIMEQEAQVTSYLKESIDGIETMKAYQYENTIKSKLAKLYNDFANKNVKGTLIYNLQDTIISLVASIGIIVLLWVGICLCMKHIIDIADLFVFYYLINYFLDPVSNLINIQPELQSAIVASERLNDILDVETEPQILNTSKSHNMYGNIKLENLDFRYGNRELVLNNISMEINKGEHIAIVGESGCGKTTLAKLLLLFYRQEKGSITIDGKNLSEYSIETIRNKIAYISQDIFLISDTIYNNLRFGNNDVSDEDIQNMCKQCGIHEFIENLPLSYNTMLNENGNNLSGGQKQRFAIVRALLRKPDILIMDEATSNLDTISEKSIKKIIDDFSNKMICIIIAHRIHTIKNCD